MGKSKTYRLVSEDYGGVFVEVRHFLGEFFAQKWRPKIECYGLAGGGEFGDCV